MVVSHRSQLQGTCRKGWRSGLRLIGDTQLLSLPNLLLLKQLQPCHMLFSTLYKLKLVISEWFETQLYLPSFHWIDNLLAPVPWTVAQLNSEANCLNLLNTFPCKLESHQCLRNLSPFQVMAVLGFLSPEFRTALLPPVPTWDVLMF